MKKLFFPHSTDDLESLENLIKKLCDYPQINNYINTHTLINKEIVKNDCYEILFNPNDTVVLLHTT